ncbi:MAG: hypothetical protein LW724_12175 [Planctomycetaceae bacterium]|jgi:hypothetical protein|nr:hypothetical protein [Planctomycetaceae bacterium]
MTVTRRIAARWLFVVVIVFGCSRTGDLALWAQEGDFHVAGDPVLIERKLELPETLDQVASPTQEELKELSQWTRWLCLMNLPANVEDTRKWGKQRRVWDGLDVKLDGMRIDTKQRWKMANDGTWSRYLIEFVDPANELKVEVKKFDVEPDGKKFTTSVWVVAPLKLFGRVNQFARDVQLVSVSAKADATVRMKVDCQVEIKLIPVSFPPDVEFRPKVTDATIELLDFRVHEISQIHGQAAEWIGEGIREILDRKLTEYREKLVIKMNQTISKQQSKLRISASKWLTSSMNLASKQTSTD